jgi:hypothetical protein
MAPIDSYRHVLSVRNAEQDRIDSVKRLLASQGWVLLQPGTPLIGTRLSASAALRCISLASHGG